MPSDPPKAHRRLVPRKPKSDDSEVDATKRTSSPRLDRGRASRPRQRDVQPADSLEMTNVREGIDLDDLEVTAQRAPAPPPPEDVIAEDIETLGGVPPSAFGFHEPPPIPDAPGWDEPALDDDIDHAPRLPFGLDPASASFEPSRQLDRSQPVAPSPPPVDPDAWSDLEPTSLKPTSPHADAEDRPTTHISPAERGLLAAMAEGHEASRKVYMQWLERRGERARAEYLRLDAELAAMTPLDLRYQDTQDQLRVLGDKISVDWRSRVSRALIENCGVAQCPSYWRALPADTDDVRRCAGCGHEVYFCVTIDLARSRVQSGQRVAVDVTVERAPGDLVATCASCRVQVPPGTRFCPHCGQSMYR